MHVLCSPDIYQKWHRYTDYYLYFSLKALISLRFRFSALSLIKEKTAHNAAGSHPIKVICKIRQIIPRKSFPLKIKERKGSKIAISI